MRKAVLVKQVLIAVWVFPMLGNAALTYYVDSVAGNNERSGKAPDRAWADFSNINGRTLKAGDRLLIKRGSVINQGLRVQALGSPDAWVEIGAYGEGMRPMIRRNRELTEFCADILKANCLRISGLTFAYAGKGLTVRSGKELGNVIIEDCVVHHIEGIYREKYNLSGMPGWQEEAKIAWPRLSGGIIMGGGRDMTIRNCDIFQTSWGYFVGGGTRVTIDAVNVHDNYILNTSPHPSINGVTDSILKNSVFDAAGYHAAYGTMGLMLGGPKNFTIRNCTFRNQPDSGSPDQGGVDFEGGGDGTLIEQCTFENNAGPGIEVLGLTVPQPVNVEVRHSRFIKNSSESHKFPTEFYVFGNKKHDPKVECSTGVIHNNGYVLNPGVQFFQNKSTPELTDWTLRDNTEFASVEALREAMPFNDPPGVRAGEDICTPNPVVVLSGSVTDEGKPESNSLSVQWEVLEGPGPVQFEDASSAATTAVFSEPGEYMLRLKGTDGELWQSDMVYVSILDSRTELLKGWEFNGTLDKEGWTEEGLGEIGWPDPTNAKFKAEPVKYVTGGEYIVTFNEADSAKMVSPKGLGLKAEKREFIEVRLQNCTNAEQMKFSFITKTNQKWSHAKTVPFDVVPNDKQMRVYRINVSKVYGWKDTIDQLRLEPVHKTGVTGSMRIDYLRVLGDAKTQK